MTTSWAYSTRDITIELRAYNIKNGDGSYSSAGDINLSDVLPPAPSDLKVESFSKREIDLSWSDNSLNETAFVIQRKTEAGSYEDLAQVLRCAPLGAQRNTTKKRAMKINLIISNN